MKENDSDAAYRRGLFIRVISLKYYWLSCFIFVFLYTSVPVTHAQETAVPQPDTEQKVSEPEKPAGIPITEISQSAQEARIALNKISTNLEPDAGILTIKGQLPSFLHSLKKLQDNDTVDDVSQTLQSHQMLCSTPFNAEFVLIHIVCHQSWL
jgi:hypothetical protein